MFLQGLGEHLLTAVEVRNIPYNKTSQYKELYNNWINCINFGIERKRLFTGFSFFFRKKLLLVWRWPHGGHVDD